MDRNPKTCRSLTDKAAVWEKELEHDPDKDFLLKGIRHGFDIVNSETVPLPVDMPNHKSALSPENRPKVEKQILDEIANGNYVVVHHKPRVISALGAIPKAHSDEIRLIHDCSRPEGQAVNDYAHLEYKVKYQSLQDAVSHVTKDCYCAKVDLKSAYRSVAISEASWTYSGLKWTFTGDEEPTFMVDKKMMFGSRLAPGIFHRLSQSVRRMLQRRGIDACVVFLDDFIVIAKTRKDCLEAMNCLLTLLRSLGFSINWNKVVGPSQRITFLGINIDTIRMMLELPRDKVQELHDLLDSFTTKARASRRQLESLAGKLNWSAQVVRGGRVYLRRILDQIHKLRAPHHKAKLTPAFQADIHWWKQCLVCFHGRAICWYPSTTHLVAIDASSEACGFFCDGDWGCVNFKCDYPDSQALHINQKEMLSALFAARKWGHLWRKSIVLFGTDNITTRAALQKQTSRNSVIMAAIRELFVLSVKYDFEIDCFYRPGVHNVIPDAISRLHEPGQLHRLIFALPQWGYSPAIIFPLAHHVSFKTFCMIFSRNVENR